MLALIDEAVWDLLEMLHGLIDAAQGWIQSFCRNDHQLRSHVLHQVRGGKIPSFIYLVRNVPGESISSRQSRSVASLIS